jgi:hypothetical protein
MNVGDLVKHKYGTMQGSGVILGVRPFDWKVARILWTAHGQTKIHEEVATRYLEVINASR